MTEGEKTQKPLRRSVRVRVEGRVQGVGFRLFVEREAIKNRIDGFVRNRRDGGVEAVFAGAHDDIETMIEMCHRGPHGSNVQFVKVLEEHDDASTGFHIGASV